MRLTLLATAMPLLVLAAIVDVQQNAVKATLVRQDAFDNGGGIRRGKRDIFDVLNGHQGFKEWTTAAAANQESEGRAARPNEGLGGGLSGTTENNDWLDGQPTKYVAKFMADQESEGPVLPEADKTMYFGRGEGSGVQTTMHNNGGITGYRPYVYRPYADTPMSGRDRQAETMTAEERANQAIQAIKDIDKWMPNFARELLGGRLDETIGTRGLWGQVNQIVDALTDTDSFNPAEDTIRIPALPPRSPPAGGGGPARRAGIGLWGRQQ